MQSLLVLGSTGSIGTQTLELVDESAGALGVAGLAAGGAWERLAEQCARYRPRLVAIHDEAAAERLAPRLPPGTRLLRGRGALEQIARECEYDVAVHGVVGAAGLPASVAVLERGKTLALANKESLVLAGALLMPLAEQHGARIVPVDSEHSAIFQCLRGERLDRVRRVILTASGGPFLRASRAEMESASPEAALKHPNWSMGPRISVGSATLMNKALELIELQHLFGLGRERIEVVIHPQSLVHSLVEFVDGSVIAQMGPPDMRLPIHYALHHPDRAPGPRAGFDLAMFKRLDFEAPDLARFPALELGYRCLDLGGDSGAVLNAADEVAVDAFLKREIAFTDVARVNAAVLARRSGRAGSVAELLAADASARAAARREIDALQPARRVS